MVSWQRIFVPRFKCDKSVVNNGPRSPFFDDLKEIRGGGNLWDQGVKLTDKISILDLLNIVLPWRSCYHYCATSFIKT